MKYIIGSSVETDEIHLPDGRVMTNMPGGAGFYALAGLKVWSDDVVITGGIGPGYMARHRDWYEQNGVCADGLVVRFDVTPTTVITYFPDGDRTDVPNVGLDVFRQLDPTPAEIERFCGADTRGVYLFKHLDRTFLDAMVAMKHKYGFSLMWEISEDAAVPENLEAIKRYLPEIDVFSINKKEACQLYANPDAEAVADLLLQNAPNWVFYRQGARGAYMLADGKKHFCPSVQNAVVEDPTGGGNSSSAAVLYAYCEGVPPQRAGVMGSVAAARIIAQYGPPMTYTPADRAEAERLTDRTMRATPARNPSKP